MSHYENTQPLDILGEHEKISEIRRGIQLLAQTDQHVLISGEKGTGKTLIAHNIHHLSRRSPKPFIHLNCSTIPSKQHVAGLFGSMQPGPAASGESSVNDPAQGFKGYLAQANNGTIFLNEIADLSLAAQAALVQLLDGSAGGPSPLNTSDLNVRIIGATQHDLRVKVEQGTFLHALYSLFMNSTLIAPPLREVPSDIPRLARHFVGQICEQHSRPLLSLSNTCAEAFQQYRWPGNMLELKNALERMVILGDEHLELNDLKFDQLTCEGLRETSRSANTIPLANGTMSLKEFKQRSERQYIIEQLIKHGGNVSRLARSLKVDRTNLHKKMTQLDIKREQLFS